MTTIAARRHVSSFTQLRTAAQQPALARPAALRPVGGTVDTFEPGKPRVAPVVTSTPNDARVKEAMVALQKLLIASNGAITSSMVETLVRGIAQPRTNKAEG